MPAASPRKPGSLMETIRFIEIGGWVYTRAVPFGERSGAPTPPPWVVPLLMRSVPSLRRRVATARSALDRDWSGQQIDTWYRRRDDLSGQLTALRRADLPGMSDDGLDAHVRSVISWGMSAWICTSGYMPRWRTTCGPSP